MKIKKKNREILFTPIYKMIANNFQNLSHNEVRELAIKTKLSAHSKLQKKSRKFYIDVLNGNVPILSDIERRSMRKYLGDMTGALMKDMRKFDDQTLLAYGVNPKLLSDLMQASIDAITVKDTPRITVLNTLTGRRIDPKGTAAKKLLRDPRWVLNNLSRTIEERMQKTDDFLNVARAWRIRMDHGDIDPLVVFPKYLPLLREKTEVISDELRAAWSKGDEFASCSSRCMHLY